MTCSEVERVLPEFLDRAPDDSFPDAVHQAEFETHVKSCLACADLVADLKLISSAARQMVESEEPAPRVWVRIAAELRAEGIIRDPVPTPARPALVPTAPRRRWSAVWLAPVAAALLAAGAYVVSHKPVAQVVTQQVSPVQVSPVQVAPLQEATPGGAASPVTGANVVTPAPETAHAQRSEARTNSVRPNPTKPANPEVAAAHAVAPSPSVEDQQFLSVVSTLAPSVRATYESQLQAVNADIRETQAYVNRNPRDADARQHLMDAYQEKALLYQIAMDRIQ
ncbi:MAG: hypothetical protein WCA97_14315 [Terriglobales bacterium]|jgi:hypothetical protein